MVIGVVIDKEIDLIAFFFNLLEHSLIGFVIHPVIAIDDLEELAGRFSDTCLNTGSMSAVRLMDDFDDAGITALKIIGNLRSLIFRAIIDDDDFDLFSTAEQGFDRMGHIVLRVITADDNG